MTRTPIVAIGLAAALCCGAAMAQNTNTGMTPKTTPGVTPSTSPGMAQNTNADKSGKSFMTNAMEGDYAEIDVGKLAQEKGTSQAVKDFGQKLVTDHSANLEKAKQVASGMGVKDPGGSAYTQKAEYLKLKVLSGKTFDSTFAKDMVSDHQKDIKDFQKEAAKSGLAADFAKETVPKLQEHLQIAQSLTSQTTGSK